MSLQYLKHVVSFIKISEEGLFIDWLIIYWLIINLLINY